MCSPRLVDENNSGSMHSAFRFNGPIRAGLPFVYWGAWASGLEVMALVET